MSRIVYVLILGLAMRPAVGDVLHFRDGTVREGKVVRQGAEEIEVEFVTPAGSLTIVYPTEKVERIEMKKTAAELLADEYRDRLAALDPDDADAWLRLGRWCSEHPMLQKHSRNAYEHVLAIEPEHPQAREAMGYVKFRGVWMTEDEAMGAQGYVRHDGRWLTGEAYREAVRNEVVEDTVERIKERLTKDFAEREKELLDRIDSSQARAERYQQDLDDANDRLGDLVDRIEHLERSRPRTLIIRQLYRRRPDWWLRMHKSAAGESVHRKSAVGSDAAEEDPKPAGPLKRKSAPAPDAAAETKTDPAF